MQDILRTLQEELQAALTSTQNSTHRDYLFPKAKNVIKVAMGIRRSGKTYFLFQTIRKLVAEGITLEQILHINFEDDRLAPMDHKAMGKMIDTWFTLHPQNHDRTCFIFLDEVQNVDGWPLVLRRVLDTKNTQIYVTGSSAKLLSKEIATSLRGRSLAIEILPYDFSEYLATHKLEKPSSSMGGQSLDKQRSYLLDYFHIGGFPGVQTLPPNERLETLQNYVETVVFRDIVERHQIANVELLKYFTHSLLKNISAPFSVNKFYKDIKSQGYKVSKDTLHSYLSYLEDAFLIFSVPIFTESLRKIQTTPKKIYSIDNGLAGASSFNLSENLGKLLENQVYLHLRRHGKKVFYFRNTDGYEVDFVTQDREGRYELVQVVWDASDPKTFEREERALRLAEKELGVSGKIIDWKAFLLLSSLPS